MDRFEASPFARFGAPFARHVGLLHRSAPERE
jgi:hypothetical protein